MLSLDDRNTPDPCGAGEHHRAIRETKEKEPPIPQITQIASEKNESSELQKEKASDMELSEYLRNLRFAVVRDERRYALTRASPATTVAPFVRRQKKGTADFADYADCISEEP